MMQAVVRSALVLGVAVATAAFQVYGDIGAKWRALGASAGPLGVPRSDEAPTADGGRMNVFASGFVTWHPKYGAHAVYGEIAGKWNAMGRERGAGYPTTDESAAPRGGRFNDFSNGVTIDWTPQTGTHAVVGLIRTRWLATGREGGTCGYPLTDEFAVEGGRRSNFERGFIAWRSGAPTAQSQCGTAGNSTKPKAATS